MLAFAPRANAVAALIVKLHSGVWEFDFPS